jgi:holliday junction DNA helicase RuvA
MLAKFTGSVDMVKAGLAVIDVHGVGFEVHMPSSDLAALHVGAEVSIYTSLTSANDVFTLYGFLSQPSKELFIQLQKVNGVGPRVALSLLSTLGVTKLAQAVSTGDVSLLSSAPGLGKKGAQKIILELSGKIEVGGGSEPSQEHADSGSQQVVEGLKSLGWQETDARKVVRRVCEEGNYSLPLQANDIPLVLKAALAFLDRGR